MTTPYTDRIQALAPVYDHRHVEAYMRCENGTLDALSPAKFSREVMIACQCIDEGGTQAAEGLAKSYGF